MGFFNKLFGGREEFPELDADSAAARRVEELKDPLESLADQVPDTLEVVLADEGEFVFIGKPPKQFGVAWFEDGQVKNFKTLVDEKGISGSRLATVTDRLREAYEQHKDDPRFSATLGDRRVVVTPSPQLEHEVEEIIHEIA